MSLFHLNHPSSFLHGKTLQLIMCFLLVIVTAASGTTTATVVLGDDGSANAWQASTGKILHLYFYWLVVYLFL